MSIQNQKKSLFEEIKDEYLTFLDNWLLNSGINPNIGRIMQILRSENKALPQKFIYEKLGLNKSTVSRMLNVMDDMNLLTKSVIYPSERSGDKFQYELRDNSLFYIVISFLRKNYDLFKQRTEDNKILQVKIQNLPIEEKEKEEVQYFSKMIEEEVLVFNIINEKFDQILKELEKEMIKAKVK